MIPPIADQNVSFLKIINVKKTYQAADQKIEVLKGIHLALNSSESLALVGRSGSGKSTFLNLLSGIDTPDEGSIELDGHEISKLSASERTIWRRQNIGLVFQQFQLIPYFTALENVMLALDIQGVPVAESKSRASEFLDAVGLKDRRSHFPHQLSGGECQRTAIARALVGQPKIVLADEPSGSLDEETGNEILDLFFTLQRQTRSTLIFVTHSRDLANRCQRIVRMEGGRLHEGV